MSTVIIPNTLSTSEYCIFAENKKPINGMFPFSQDFRSIKSQAMEYNAGRQEQGHAGYSINIINCTQEEIIVIDQFNCVTTIGPVEPSYAGNRGLTGCIAVEVVHNRPPRSDLLSDHNHERYRAYSTRGCLTRIRDFFFRSPAKNEVVTESTNQVTMFVINEATDKFHEHDGSFYLEDVKLAFAVVDTQEIIIHPDTDSKEMLEHFPDYDTNMLSLKLFINDSANRYASMFINVAGSVERIPIQRKSNVEDGLYISRATNIRRKTDMEHRFFRTDDPAIPYKLYRSKEEALVDGNIAKSIENQTAIVKQATAQIQSRTTLEEAERKNEQTLLAKLEQMQNQLEEENQRKYAEALRNADERVRIAEAEAKEERLRADRALTELRSKLQQSELKTEEIRKASLSRDEYKRKVVLEAAKYISTMATVAVTLLGGFIAVMKLSK